LPIDLKNLYIGDCYSDRYFTIFNHSLDKLPPNLECLDLERNFNKSLKNLPKSLLRLTLADCLQEKMEEEKINELLPYTKISFSYIDYSDSD
jgi:hypothetical protein